MSVIDSYKPSTFLSRSMQQNIVNSIEKDFRNLLATGHTQPSTSVSEKMRTLSKKIFRYTSHYYFEEDLVDYMFSINSFLERYIEAKPHNQTMHA